MNVDEVVRAALHEQADEQRLPSPGFADRILAVRRRRRIRTLASVATATAAVVAVAVAVPLLDSGHGSGTSDTQLASQANRSDIIAHPEQSPPRDLIAAGNTALAAYYTSKRVKDTPDKAVDRRVYGILDQKTGKYVQQDRWSYVAVAPGMRTAAVLEGDLPARRIGLLDLFTGKVDRWIPVDHGVGAVTFSSDGGKLLATTYKADPDLRFRKKYDANDDGKRDWEPALNSPRTGFYVLDVASGKGSWSAVSHKPNKGYYPAEINARQDFGFSADGKLVWSGLAMDPGVRYYDFKGNEVAVPANEKHLSWFDGARLSPNGKLAAGGFAGGATTTATQIIDPYTGKRLYKTPGQQQLVWVDNKRLIEWDIAPGSGEYHQHLVLVTIGNDKTVPLSGFLKGTDGNLARWTPVFAER